MPHMITHRSSIRTSRSLSTASRSRRRVRAAVESLEARLVLSTFVVNTIADQIDPASSTMVSLLDAVARADAQTSGSVTISFDPTVFATAQTINLSTDTQSLELSNTNGSITITGPAAGVTIKGPGLSVDSGVTASVSDLSLSGGGITNAGNLTVSNSTSSNNPGGGIHNSGTLLLQNSTVSDNVGNGTPFGLGGGLYNNGTANVVDCTFFGNAASVYSGDLIRPDLGSGTTLGGGIFNAGTFSLTNSTLSGNAADNGGGIYNIGTATVSDSTIDGNGQNIDNNLSGVLTLANTIAAAGNGSVDVMGTIKSLGHNLIGEIDSTSSGYVSSDLTGTTAKPLNPDLSPLGNYGGPTQTQLPLAGSPAIGAGSVTLIPAGISTDQRGYARVVSGKVDIGAVELQALITGTVFNDANGDGTQDDGETGLAGVKVYADLGNVGYFVSGDPTTTTNAAGGYALSGLAAGNYIVRQVPPAGYAQTSPAGGLGHHVTVSTGQTLSGQNFGDETTAAAAATVDGVVYDDFDGVGMEIDHDNGVPYVQIYDDLGNVGHYVAGDPTTMANAGGGYVLSGLPAGNNIIRQVIPAGYKQTQPSGGLGYHLVLTPGAEVSNVNFGDQAIATPTAAITGTVFNDANGDGVQDNGETGLADVEVYLDLGNVGYFVTGDPTTMTDASGDYTLTGLAAGSYIVRQVPPKGYVQTSPSNGYGHHVTVAAGETLSAENFGDKA